MEPSPTTGIQHLIPPLFQGNAGRQAVAGGREAGIGGTQLPSPVRGLTGVAGGARDTCMRSEVPGARQKVQQRPGMDPQALITASCVYCQLMQCLQGLLLTSGGFCMSRLSSLRLLDRSTLVL